MATRKPSLSAPLAIHAVAKAVDLSSREFIDLMASWGVDWDIASHMKRLDEAQIREVEARMGVVILTGEEPAPAKPARGRISGSKLVLPEITPASKQDARKKAAPAAEAPVLAPEVGEVSPADEAPAVDETPENVALEAAVEAAAGELVVEATAEATAAPEAAAVEEAPADETPAPEEAAEAAPQEPEVPRDYVAEAREILVNTLSSMGYTHPRVTVREGDRRLEINIAGAGVEDLLGRRNASASTDIIEALQFLVQKALYGADHRNGPVVIIDVLNYRQARVNDLKAASERLAEFVRKTGKVVRVAAMNSIDRRAFHQVLTEDRELRSESVGFGPLRRLEVSKNQPRREREDRREHAAPSEEHVNAEVAPIAADNAVIEARVVSSSAEGAESAGEGSGERRERDRDRRRGRGRDRRDRDDRGGEASADAQGDASDVAVDTVQNDSAQASSEDEASSAPEAVESVGAEARSERGRGRGRGRGRDRDTREDRGANGGTETEPSSSDAADVAPAPEVAQESARPEVAVLASEGSEVAGDRDEQSGDDAETSEDGASRSTGNRRRRRRRGNGGGNGASNGTGAVAGDHEG